LTVLNAHLSDFFAFTWGCDWLCVWLFIPYFTHCTVDHKCFVEYLTNLWRADCQLNNLLDRETGIRQNKIVQAQMLEECALGVTHNALDLFLIELGTRLRYLKQVIKTFLKYLQFVVEQLQQVPING